jgi:hypothetical protein
MRLALDPSQPSPLCKLKRVYARLPLRVHSAAMKGLARGGPGNPLRAERAANGVFRAAGWSCERPRLYVQGNTSVDTCRRLNWDRSRVVDRRAGALGVA